MHKIVSNIREFSSNSSFTAIQLSELYQVKKFVWTFILPSLCTFGLLTNIINVIVFSQKAKLKNIIYRYFQWHSTVDLVYLALCLSRLLINLDEFKTIHCLYWTKIFEAYVYRYITASLAMIMIFIELIIATKRLLMVMNITLTIKIRFRTVLLICAVMGFVLLAPMAVSFRVVDVKSSKKMFEFETCKHYSNKQAFLVAQANVSYFEVLKKFFLSVLVFRGIIAPISLLIINVGIAVRFRRYFRNKKNLTSLRTSSTQSKLFAHKIFSRN